MDAIRIEAVSSCAAGSWYDQDRRLRHRVFVVEQGWTGLSSACGDATIPDPADAKAHFWLARSTGGALVGAVRVRAVRDVFPHEELFCHHLARHEMAVVRPWMGTLNSLVVDRDWRSRPCAGSNGHHGTVASLLLDATLSGSAGAGLRALVATAQTLVSARALMRAGFRVIDPPVPYSFARGIPDVQPGDRAHRGRSPRACAVEVFRRTSAASPERGEPR